MKKRLLGFLLGVILASMCIGCGSENTTSEPTDAVESTTTEESTPAQTTEQSDVPAETAAPTPEATEEPTPEPTAEPTPEPTEAPTPEPTAEPTPEPTAEPTPEPAPQVVYTYTDMNATMYATQTVNVRDLPGTDGSKVGSLSTNQEVAVTGQCNETGWYRFDYNGQTAFVSNKYLSTEMVEVTPPADTNNTTTTECPYPLYQIIDEGGDRVYFYRAWDDSKGPNWADADYNVTQWNILYKQCAQTIAERHGWDFSSVDYAGPAEPTPYYIGTYQVYVQYLNVIGPDGTIVTSRP